MESNLTPEYIKFVDEGQNIQSLVQKVIDRVQYLPGFLGELQTLLNEFEDPFEEVPIDAPEEEEIKTSATGSIMEKRLKPAYCK